ncbi:LOB domain-containing protein [Heracleum sosnowskyi]|uniref:LOB domain-containing protein n=1 Tax=Heracleum sosnowskyi TaxID=360622 RepID=A0AAD8IWF0_9APIA|nr:LOB domain-containing protein [Heracleum sosnowskyi]
MQKENGSLAAACASCRHQRKKCTENCVLAPYFPLNKNKEFQAVHKLFGVSNVTKILSGLDVRDRRRAVDSLIWEASCRQNDPILGSFGEFSRVFEELQWYKDQFRNNFQTVAPRNNNNNNHHHNVSFLNNNRSGFNSSSNNSGFMSMNKNRNTSAPLVSANPSSAVVPANSYPAGYSYHESYQCTDRVRDELSYNCSSLRNAERLKEDSNNSSSLILHPHQQYGIQQIENFKEESSNGSVILPQHYSMSGFNQPYYQLSGQYGPSTEAKP